MTDEKARIEADYKGAELAAIEEVDPTAQLKTNKPP